MDDDHRIGQKGFFLQGGPPENPTILMRGTRFVARIRHTFLNDALQASIQYVLRIPWI